MNISKERLFALGYGADAHPEEIEQMALSLLAVYAQEPVADVVAWNKAGEERTCDVRLRRFDLETGPLFSHPAPSIPAAVPDGLRLALSNAGIAAPESDEVLFATHEKYVQMLVTWVKDRKPFSAAMLQAEPVSQPYRLPDGWIPVSERFPENKPGCFEYIVFDSLNNRAHHDYWNAPEPGDDAFTPFWNHYGNFVTHWQPLPAPPKE